MNTTTLAELRELAVSADLAAADAIIRIVPVRASLGHGIARDTPRPREPGDICHNDALPTDMGARAEITDDRTLIPICAALTCRSFRAQQDAASDTAAWLARTGPLIDTRSLLQGQGMSSAQSARFHARSWLFFFPAVSRRTGQSGHADISATARKGVPGFPRRSHKTARVRSLCGPRQARGVRRAETQHL